LKQAKRFHATAAFDTDTVGLKRAKEIGTGAVAPFSPKQYNSELIFVLSVEHYKGLMKDFPIDELLTASEIEKVSSAVKQIFTHMKRTKNAHYPITRYLHLVEAVSRDMCTKVLALMRSKRLMHIPYGEFEKVRKIHSQ